MKIRWYQCVLVLLYPNQSNWRPTVQHYFPLRYNLFQQKMSFLVVFSEQCNGVQVSQEHCVAFFILISVKYSQNFFENCRRWRIHFNSTTFQTQLTEILQKNRIDRKRERERKILLKREKERFRLKRNRKTDFLMREKERETVKKTQRDIKREIRNTESPLLSLESYDSTSNPYGQASNGENSSNQNCKL